MGQWTFGRRLGLGFAVMVLFSVAIGGVGVFTLRSVVESKDRVITVDTPQLVDVSELSVVTESKSAAIRGFIIAANNRFVDRLAELKTETAAVVSRLRVRAASDESRRSIDRIVELEGLIHQAADKVFAMRRAPNVDLKTIDEAFETELLPKRDAVVHAIREFSARERERLEAARVVASESASFASTLMIAIVAAAVLLGILIAFALARGLSRQIATAVGQVQSSSAELQAAASQQATGAKEQSTAMNEITTTINELLATSRQIAESAQRVAQVAGQTATSARTGDGTVDKAQDAIAGIRRQVDLVVHHMLELGKKSQQIGAVLDIVSELAEQTNILAINATIEAAGAGESGKRFAVVADEIRKLADRVGGSTKEIRLLIEDVRGAVNTTVMATETGSKAVEAGSRQFGDVAAAFKQIGGLVGTTTEAAREIELSTKQQTTAVEQVNVAIANVAQATKETEASSSQTLTTASQLAVLSKDLLRLVQPQLDHRT